MQTRKAEDRAVLNAYLKEKTELFRNENRTNRNSEGFVILIVQYFERNVGDPEYLMKDENFDFYRCY